MVAEAILRGEFHYTGFDFNGEKRSHETNACYNCSGQARCLSLYLSFPSSPNKNTKCDAAGDDCGAQVVVWTFGMILVDTGYSRKSGSEALLTFSRYGVMRSIF